MSMKRMEGMCRRKSMMDEISENFERNERYVDAIW